MTYNILDYGAQGDGQTNDAAAIQATIHACHLAGGGRVLVPAGQVFMSGTLVLLGGIELHLEQGSILRASANYADYPPELESTPLSRGKMDDDNLPHRAFITAFEAHDMAITGGGTIDGNGRAFVGRDLGHIYEMAGPRPYLERPYTLHLIGCQGVSIRNIIIQDGAFWTLRLTGCEDGVIQGIRIRNDLKLPNNDAIDLVNCRRIRVANCDIVAGDDAICLKTHLGTQAFGPCEDITVTGCTLQTTSSALKIGNEIFSPIRNVVFDSCVIRRSHRGLSVHVGEPGDVENVLFSNMVVETQLFHTDWWGRGEPIYINSTAWRSHHGVGRIRNLRFSQILARSENGVMVLAQHPGYIENVVFEGVQLEIGKHTAWPGDRQDLRPREGEGLPLMPTHGFTLHNAHRITLRNCSVRWEANPPGYYGQALATHGVRGLRLEGFSGDDAHS